MKVNEFAKRHHISLVEAKKLIKATLNLSVSGSRTLTEQELEVLTENLPQTNQIEVNSKEMIALPEAQEIEPEQEQETVLQEQETVLQEETIEEQEQPQTTENATETPEDIAGGIALTQDTDITSKPTSATIFATNTSKRQTAIAANREIAARETQQNAVMDTVELKRLYDTTCDDVWHQLVAQENQQIEARIVRRQLEFQAKMQSWAQESETGLNNSQAALETAKNASSEGKQTVADMLTSYGILQ